MPVVELVTYTPLSSALVSWLRVPLDLPTRSSAASHCLLPYTSQASLLQEIPTTKQCSNSGDAVEAHGTVLNALSYILLHIQPQQCNSSDGCVEDIGTG